MLRRRYGSSSWGSGIGSDIWVVCGLIELNYNSGLITTSFASSWLLVLEIRVSSMEDCRYLLRNERFGNHRSLELHCNHRCLELDIRWKSCSSEIEGLSTSPKTIYSAWTTSHSVRVTPAYGHRTWRQTSYLQTCALAWWSQALPPSSCIWHRRSTSWLAS